MLDFLKEEGVDPAVIEGIAAFRAAHPVPEGMAERVPAPQYRYYGRDEFVMGAETFIRDTEIVNPKELAHHILGRVLEWSGEVPLDDMTVLAAGVWKK